MKYCFFTILSTMYVVRIWLFVNENTQLNSAEPNGPTSAIYFTGSTIFLGTQLSNAGPFFLFDGPGM